MFTFRTALLDLEIHMILVFSTTDESNKSEKKFHSLLSEYRLPFPGYHSQSEWFNCSLDKIKSVMFDMIEIHKKSSDVWDMCPTFIYQRVETGIYSKTHINKIGDSVRRDRRLQKRIAKQD